MQISPFPNLNLFFPNINLPLLNTNLKNIRV